MTEEYDGESLASFKAYKDKFKTVKIREEYLKELISILESYDAAADKFIQKVETGMAFSKETYKELKEVRGRSQKYRDSDCGWDG